mgnify:CR=1 FL=1
MNSAKRSARASPGITSRASTPVCSAQRRSRVTLEVRETNLPAQLFFRNVGFRAVSVLRCYYHDTPEDAYLMQYRYRPESVPVEITTSRITRLAG